MNSKPVVNTARLIARESGRVQYVVSLDDPASDGRRLSIQDEKWIDTDEAAAFDAELVAIAWPDGDYDYFD